MRSLITLKPSARVDDRGLAGRVLLYLLAQSKQGCEGSTVTLTAYLAKVREGLPIRVSNKLADMARDAVPTAYTFDTVLSIMKSNNR